MAALARTSHLCCDSDHSPVRVGNLEPAVCVHRIGLHCAVALCIPALTRGNNVCGPREMTTQTIGAAITEIVDGIDEESRVSSKSLRFEITDISHQANICKVFVRPISNSSSLDESLEGASAWWLGPPTGSADVLSVIPDNNQLNIRYLSSPPPHKGQEIRIYPPRYLEALRDCWDVVGSEQVPAVLSAGLG